MLLQGQENMFAYGCKLTAGGGTHYINILFTLGCLHMDVS